MHSMVIMPPFLFAGMTRRLRQVCIRTQLLQCASQTIDVWVRLGDDMVMVMMMMMTAMMMIIMMMMIMMIMMMRMGGKTASFRCWLWYILKSYSSRTWWVVITRSRSKICPSTSRLYWVYMRELKSCMKTNSCAWHSSGTNENYSCPKQIQTQFILQCLKYAMAMSS